MPNKKNFYDAATEKLVQQVKSMRMPAKFDARYDLAEMVRRFRETFKNEELRSLVLNPKYEESRLANANFSSGFCGIASYTWTHLFRMPDESPIWKLKQYSDNNSVYGLKNHVWLENRFENSILDLTFDQSLNGAGTYVEIPYFLGKPIDENFFFNRAITFADYLGINLEDIVFVNILMNKQKQ